MITGKVQNTASNFLRAAGARLLPALSRSMEKQMLLLERWVQTKHLKGGNPLHYRTGNLFTSIHHRVEQNTNAVRGVVFVANTAPYGKVHEYGGTFTVREYMRRKLTKPKPKMVRFRGRKMSEHPAGPPALTMIRVRSHTATYPERSFMRVSLAERQDAMRASLMKDVISAMRKKP